MNFKTMRGTTSALWWPANGLRVYEVGAFSSCDFATIRNRDLHFVKRVRFVRVMRNGIAYRESCHTVFHDIAEETCRDTCLVDRLKFYTS